MTTQLEFHERERQEALRHAPYQELNQEQLREEMAAVPVAVLRQAALRWSAPRGRRREAVIDGIVAALHNPYTNRGDSYRIALGHIRACQLPSRRAP